MRPVSKPVIAQYNNDDYDVLRTHLFANLGAYCSYCESPLSNDSAVEHKVPKNAKNGFPRFGTQWRNLLLVCQSCNSAKGQEPSRAATMNKEAESDYLRTLNRWVWPDATAPMRNEAPPPVDNTYMLFAFDYSAKTQVQLRDLGLVRDSTVKPGQPWTTASHTMLWIKPNDANIALPTLRQRVLNTIQGFNLNYYNTSDRAYNDRRVVNRTKARESANQALANLEAAARAAGGNLADPRVALMTQSICQTIIATGFWSVWFWILRTALDNPAVGSYWLGFTIAERKRLLEALLIYYSERIPATDLIFPGTEYGRLNMAAFV